MTKPSLPLGYAQRVDKETGYDFYINLVTGESQWTMPRASAYATSSLCPNIGMVDPDTVLPPHGYYDYLQQTRSENNIHQHPARYNQYHWQQSPQSTQSWQQNGCISPQAQQIPHQISPQPHITPYSYTPSSYNHHSQPYYSSSHYRANHRYNRSSSDSSSSYQTLTGVLAGSLAALGLHMFMENDEGEGEDQNKHQPESAVWYEEY